MIDRLKMFELLRYNVNSNVERVSERIISELSDSSIETVSAVFATCFSLVSIDIGEAFYRVIRSFPIADDIAKAIIVPAVKHMVGVSIKSTFIVFTYILVFLISFSVAKKIRLKWVKRKKQKELLQNKESDYKKFIDDFDHTACDALLFTEYFIEASKSEEGQKQKFDLYEAIYYLGKAQAITDIVFSNKSNCVSDSRINKIAIHRLVNAVKMMDELEDKISIAIRNLILDDLEKTSLEANFSRIKKNMAKLNKELLSLT